MKILVFTSLYPNNVWPHHGVFIKERMTRVAQLDDCQVQVVAPVPFFPPFKFTSRWHFSQVLRHEVIEGLDVYHPRYFMTPKAGMSSYGVSMYLSVLPVIKKIQRRFDFDLIDAHYVYPDGLAAVLLGSLLKKPVVVSARGSDINQFAHLHLIRGLLRYTLGKADRLIAVCTALKNAMVQLGVPEDKIAVIPNGVDINKFFPLPKEDARRRLNLSNTKKIILSVGGLIPRKGFDVLIKAFYILMKEQPARNMYLILAGEGPARKELEQLVSSCGLNGSVYFAGDVAHEDLHLWYSAADLFCLASSREGWPNVILESLACGTPVVATDVWGIPEIIRSDNIGLLTKRNAQDIAATLCLAFGKQWQPDEIVRYARSQTWDIAALSVLHVFREVLEKPTDKAA